MKNKIRKYFRIEHVGKASRDIFLRAAQQEKGNFQIVTLMPGLVKTEMLQEAKDLGMNSGDFFRGSKNDEIDNFRFRRRKFAIRNRR